MKNLRCAKCEENQRRAGEALGLFNECMGALMDAEEVLREVLAEFSGGGLPGGLRGRIADLVRHAGERRKEEAEIRNTVKPN